MIVRPFPLPPYPPPSSSASSSFSHGTGSSSSKVSEKHKLPPKQEGSTQEAEAKESGYSYFLRIAIHYQRNSNAFYIRSLMS